jgi:hypothetical protein
MNFINELWNDLSYFNSEQNSKKYLLSQYEKELIKEANKKSFQNSTPFLYYIEHGKNFFNVSNQSPLSIKPILLFYGLIQLLKACLLTVSPEYPESTTLLAHGVTTRKRKKQGYSFLDDEVKIQKNGLFTYVAEKMYNINSLEGEKFNMLNLLHSIPELSNLFLLAKNDTTFLPVNNIEEKYCIPNTILDFYHYTSERLESFLQGKLQEKKFNLVKYDNDHFSFTSQTLSQKKNIRPPFYLNFKNKKIVIKTKKESIDLLPEILYHYLLLYNLSMISRYETEWWTELLNSYSTEEYPYIQNFLAMTENKIVYIVHTYLFSKFKDNI